MGGGRHGRWWHAGDRVRAGRVTPTARQTMLAGLGDRPDGEPDYTERLTTSEVVLMTRSTAHRRVAQRSAPRSSARRRSTVAVGLAAMLGAVLIAAQPSGAAATGRHAPGARGPAAHAAAVTGTHTVL